MSRSAEVFLAQARSALAEANVEPDANERFRLAQLGALRAAGAVVAERGKPAVLRRRLVSVWVVLESIAPEYAEWAAFFAAGAQTRAAIEAGSQQQVGTRRADDQVRAAYTFLELVEASAGMLAAPLAS